MTKTKARRLRELAKGVSKLANMLSKDDKDKAMEFSHELEMLVHGAEDMPHKPAQIESDRFIKAIKTVIKTLGDMPFAMVDGLAVQHWVAVRPTDDLDFVLSTHNLDSIKELFPGGSETALVYLYGEG